MEMSSNLKTSKPPVRLSWRLLDKIPNPIGLAGSFAGVSNGSLIIAGGTNFQGEKNALGKKKTWFDSVFALESKDGNWSYIGALSKKLAYGVSVSWGNKIICVGGNDEHNVYGSVFSLELINDNLYEEPLPGLPMPLANSCGTIVGNTLYIAGGTTEQSASRTENVFFALDLGSSTLRWERLQAVPGPSRMLAVCAALDNSFYLFSGVHVSNENRRVYLTDAYRFNAESGWSKLPILPTSFAAAPTPAITVGPNILIVGGDEGTFTQQLSNNHPGFSNKVWCFEQASQTTYQIDRVSIVSSDSLLSEIVTVPVTTTMVRWDQDIVIVGGEVRPMERSRDVLLCTTT